MVADCAKFIVMMHAWRIIDQVLRAQSRWEFGAKKWFARMQMAFDKVGILPPLLRFF